MKTAFKKNEKYLYLLLILILLTVSACSQSAPRNTQSPDTESNEVQQPSAENNQANKEAPKFITIGTARSGSSVYAYGLGLADILTKNLGYSQFDAIETGGTIENLNLINIGEMEMAVGGADAYYDGRHAKIAFSEPVNATLGWKLQISVPQIVTLEKSGIQKIEDLKGKRFSIGAAGSAANITALQILELHGVGEDEVTFSYLGWNEAAEALGDGAIDAALVLGSIPSAAIQQVGLTQPIRFVDVDPKKIELNPIFGTTILKAGTYDGQAEEAIAPTVDQYIYFSPDLPEDVVYEVTKLGMENTEELGQAHPIGKVAEPITMKDVEFLNGELHPGVIKYYKEIGAY